jgi:phosphate-selective porin OprO/OprP
VLAPVRAEAAPATPTPQAVVAQPTAPPQLGYDEGFFVLTANGNFVLRLNSRVATNFLFFEPHTSQSDTATIDRARLSLDATIYKYWRLRLEDDFSSSSGLRDAYLAFNYMPELNVQIGQYKVPFSYEELLSKRYIDFVERAAVVTATVNPSRDIGVMLYGTAFHKLLQYQVAGMNGTGQNSTDNNSDKDIVARVVVHPFINADREVVRGVNFGGGMTWGRESVQSTKQGSTTTLVPNSIAGTTETGFTFFPAIPQNGDRLRVDTHAAWLYGPFSVSSEYLNAQESRSDINGANLPDLDTDGAYVGGTWLLTGEAKPFNKRLYPTHPLLSLTDPGWGAWEAALRYEYYKLRHGQGSPTDLPTYNRYDAIEAGMNWYPNEFLRFSLNYLYGDFAERGKGLSPNASKNSNNAVLGRAQLEF